MKIKLPNTSEKINQMIDCLEKKNSEKPVNLINCFGKIGLMGIPVIGFLSTIFAILLVARFGMPVGAGILIIVGIMLGCVLCHYAAYTMLPTLQTLMNNAPTKISSGSLLKVFALFVAVFGVMSLVGGLYYSIFLYADDAFFMGLFLFVFSGFWTFLLLRPQVLNIEIVEKASVGEEFIGLVSFFAKGCLKLTPVVFGLAIIFAVIQAIALIFSADVMISGIVALIYLCASAFLPIIMYIAFLSYFFTLDILNTILSLPSKIEKISK